MDATELEDVPRPTDDAFKTFYERGYRTWHRLWAGAVGDSTLPSTCLEWEHLFPQHPRLPVGLDPDDSGLVTAKSIWSSSEEHCSHPLFEQTLMITAAIGKPISIILLDDPDLSLCEWFGKDDGHLVVLMFAWAYALSARWAEIIPRASPIEYTASQAPWTTDAVFEEGGENGIPMVVELGELTGEAARWWAAVLAPGEGWKAALPHERSRLLSPWSVSKDLKYIGISLAGSSSHMSSHSVTPASFETALKYIEDYSVLHGADRASRAALAATLLLPVARLDKRNVRLHAPRGRCRKSEDMTKPGPSLFEERQKLQLDRLLTLSINAHGMKAVLGSIFYESGIPANACGGWLQGTMTLLQLKGRRDLHVLARIFFDRSPRISYLWLGAIITGAHRKFLWSTSDLLGLNRIDLHAGAWTGTLLSFIQEPVSPERHDQTSISRADECRLMFLSQEPPRPFPPIYPYSPVGYTDIRDTDLGVQLHAQCPGSHGLRFMSISWNCVAGRKDIQTVESKSVVSRSYTMNNLQDEDTEVKVDYSWLDRETDLSERVTRNLFCWMRQDGFTVAERDIHGHEWIDAFDSWDDESIHPGGDGLSTTGLNNDAQIGRWMAGMTTRRCNSI
jgi:hypothetical protein